MSTSGHKRSRAICIRAYELSLQGLTHREIADMIMCQPYQVSGKINRGKLASIRDERPVPQHGTSHADKA